MLKKYCPPLLLGISLFPLLCEIVRLYRPWTTSPLDRYDAFYMLAGVLAVFCLLVRHWKPFRPSPDSRALILAVPAFAGFAAGVFSSLNIVFFASSVAFPLCLLWLFYGWRVFVRVFPAALLAGLSAPTSSITVVSPLFCSWPVLKLGTGVLLLAYIAAGELSGVVPRMRFWLYCHAAALFFLVSILDVRPPPSGVPLRLDIERDFRDFIALSTASTPADIRFFSGCRDMERKTFFGKKGEKLMLLRIVSGNSVHNIHPASVCLMSAGWTLEHVKQKTVRSGERVHALEEIAAVRNGDRFLFYVWYSDSIRSTGSYFRFRCLWSRKKQWEIYQLCVPASGPSGLEDAASFLNDFIHEMRVEGHIGIEHKKRKGR